MNRHRGKDMLKWKLQTSASVYKCITEYEICIVITVNVSDIQP